MRRGIHAAGETAENDETSGAEIVSQRFGHADSVWGGMARADHGDSRLCQRGDVSMHVQRPGEDRRFGGGERDIRDHPA
jgi:hypothetical protein